MKKRIACFILALVFVLTTDQPLAFAAYKMPGETGVEPTSFSKEESVSLEESESEPEPIPLEESEPETIPLEESGSEPELEVEYSEPEEQGIFIAVNAGTDFDIGSVEDIQSAIQNAIDTAQGDAVTVRGSKTGAASTITLNIPSGKKVVWEAAYGGTVTGTNALIALPGNGIFEVAEGGAVAAASGRAVSADGTGTTVIVSGGEIRAANAVAVYAGGASATVTVSGGVVCNTATSSSYPVILMNSSANTGLNVTVSGTGVVEVADNGTGTYAISTSGRVEVKDAARVSAKTGRGIYASGTNSAVTVSGSSVVEAAGSGGYAIYTAGNVGIEGSAEVKATTGYGIYATGAGSTVTVSGGTVNATTGRAIYATGASATVTVSGGEVSSTATSSSNPVIQAGSKVSVNGTGKVKAAADGGYGVTTGGSVEIGGGAEVSATTGYAVNATGTASTVTVGGGMVGATSGRAVNTTGLNSAVTVSGGTVRATSGYAISAGGANSSVSVTGGLIFVHRGTADSSDIIYLQNNASGFEGVSEDGMILAWDQDPKLISYVTDSETHISKLPITAAAKWGTDGTDSGISYANGTNIGFIVLPVRVTDTGYGNNEDVEISKEDSFEEIQSLIQNAINGVGSGDAVTVRGSKTSVSSTLSLNIPSGKKVIWEAVYGGTLTGTNALIALSGNGIFEVAEGGSVAAVSGRAVSADGANTTVIVSGGEIRAANAIAVFAGGINSTVTVSGGVVCNTATSTSYPVILMNSSANTGLNVTVSGTGVVEVADNGTAAYAISTSGRVEVKDAARVSAKTGRGIYASGTNSAVTVSGGTVSATTGCAIYTTGTSSAVTVSGGEVSNTATSASYPVIQAGSKVSVNGTGKVKAAADGGYAVSTGGSVEIGGDAEVSTTTGNAVNATGTGSTVAVSGGMVGATTGRAVNTTGVNSAVTVNGGIVRATTGYAISAGGTSSSVSVTGGLIFVHRGTADSSDIIYLQNNASGFEGVSGNGMILAWDHNPKVISYVTDSETYISKLPVTAAAKWGTNGTDSGISYANGTNIGFIVLPVRVSETGYGNNEEVEISQEDSVEEIQSLIQKAINGAGSGDTVTVRGVKTGAASTITLNIPSGKKVVWEAAYGGTVTGTNALIALPGNGIFEVAEGGSVAAVSGRAVSADGANTTVIVSGGEIRAANAIAVFAGGINSTVTVSGGVVCNTATSTSYPVILINSSANTGLNVTVSGTGVVEVADNGTAANAISTSGRVEVKDAARVSAKTGRGIYASGTNSAVTVSGSGIVEAAGSGGYAIYTTGNVSIEDSAKVKATTGYGIYATGAGSVVTVSGGAVSATTGCAIYTTGTSSAITVSGGEVSNTATSVSYPVIQAGSKVSVNGTGKVKAAADGSYAVSTGGSVEIGGDAEVSATTGYAVNATGTGSTVTVSGGIVFAYGSAVMGDVIYLPNNAEGFTGVSDDGMVIAWNYSAGMIAYITDSEAHISKLPATATAKWETDGDDSGISYTNGTNTGFIVLPVYVSSTGVGSDTAVHIKQEDTYTDIHDRIQNAIDSAGNGGIVTVTGSKTGVSSTLSLNIPAGRKVIWKADYSAASYSGNVISLSGNGIFEVADGTVSNATYGRAIAAAGTSSIVMVSGGMVSTNSNTAIYAEGVSAIVLIGGGLVSTSTGIAVQAAAVTVEGTGIVEVAGENKSACAISASGNVEIKGTAEVRAKTGRAIYATGTSSTVTVSGGLVRAAAGEAIYLGGSNAAVICSGGLVFAYGGAISGAGNVIHLPYMPNGFTNPTGDGMVIAWNQSAGEISYKIDSETHIIKSSDIAAAKWSTSGSDSGIYYENGENKGFIALPVLVSDTGLGGNVSVNIAQTDTVATIQALIRDAIEGAKIGDTVTVTGCKTDISSTLSINIPAGKKVIWKAVYEASASFSNNLITISNVGAFEMADGTLSVTSNYAYAVSATGASAVIKLSGGAISAASRAIETGSTSAVIEICGGTVSTTAGYAIYVYGENTTVKVSGGTVSATTGYAICSAGANSNVTVSGGTVRAETGYAIYVSGTNSTATISDGLVFGYGSAITGYGNVIYRAAGFTVTDVGVVIAWNQGTGKKFYNIGSDTDISVLPGTAMAKWEVSGVENGIYYENNSHDGFIALPVTVASVTVNIDQTEEIEQIQERIQDAIDGLESGDTIAVAGSRTDADRTLVLFIPAGIRVMWRAVYKAGDSLGNDDLLSLTGDGALEVLGGALIATRGHAVRSNGENASVTVSGGLVFAYGNGITGNGKVIYLPSHPEGFTDPTGIGMTVAWDIDAGTAAYAFDAETDIYRLPLESTAKWFIKGGFSGIAYESGINKGVILLPATVEPCNIAITQNDPVSDIQKRIQDAINAAETGDVIVVSGRKSNANTTLALNIPTGKGVIWAADYAVDSSFEYDNGTRFNFIDLLRLTGGGTFEVAGGSISAGMGRAVYANLGSSINVTVSSGAVSSEDETAIFTGGSVLISGGSVSGRNTAIETWYSGVTVTGGTVSSANIHTIMDYGPSATVTVSGGLIFGGGSAVSGSNGIIYLPNNPKGFTGAKDTGLVIAWDRGKGTANYNNNSEIHISKSPITAVARWGTQGGSSGISYANGINTGFIPLPVTIGAGPFNVQISQSDSVSVIEEKIAVALSGTKNGDSVMVTGIKTNVHEVLCVNIPSGKKLNWRANYSAAASLSWNQVFSDVALINLSGDGIFEMTGGTIAAADGVGAVRSTGIGSGVVIDGGTVSASGKPAIASNGSIGVNGGLVFAYGESIADVIITLPDGDFQGVTGSGTVIAWDKSKGTTTYSFGTEEHISKSPAKAAAVWDTNGIESGISYTNGASKGFIALPISVSGGEVRPPVESIILSPTMLDLHVGDSATVRVNPVPSNAVLPADFKFEVEPDDGVITFIKNTGGLSASITAIGSGTAIITASGTLPGSSNQEFSVTCTVNVEVQPEYVTISSIPGLAALSPGETISLTAAVWPASASQAVQWRSVNENVVRVSASGAIAELTAISAGSTAIYASTPDGKACAAIRVTVADKRETLSLDLEWLMLIDMAQRTLRATLSAPNAELVYSLKDAVSYSALNLADVLVIDDGEAPVGNMRAITLKPAPGAPRGEYILRVAYDRAAHGDSWTECRISIGNTAGEDYPVFRLNPETVAVSTRQTVGATVAQFSLWPNAGAGHPVSLLSPGVTVRFKDDAVNDFFKLVPSGENTVDVLLEKTAGIGKKYQSDLEIIVPGISAPLLVDGKLTVNTNSSSPGLKAANVKVNTFYNNHKVALEFTGGKVTALRPEPGKELDWVILNPDLTLTVYDATERKSGTMKLEAKIEGWGDIWFPVSVNIQREYAPPSVQLVNSRMSLYTDFERTADNTLYLKAKNASDSLADLGIVGIEVDHSRAKDFMVKENSFNIVTGAFVLVANRDRTLSELKGTVPLLVSVEGAAHKIKLSVSVSQVKAATAVKLKAGMNSVTLNPNLTGGESVALKLFTSIEGFDLPKWNTDHPIQVKVYENGDKNKYNINGLQNKLSAELSGDGQLLTLKVENGADTAMTYKVELILPDVNNGKDSILTLTVNTKKRSTSSDSLNKNFYGAKAALSIRGKVDLTNGAAATISARFTNTNYGIKDMPSFEITTPGGATWDEQSPEYANFHFERVDGKNWRVSLAQDGELLPGSYKISIKSATIDNGDTVNTKAVKLSVAASKPKLAVNPAKVTLYANDPASRGVVAFAVPVGTAPVRNVTLKGAAAPNYAFKIQQLDGNTYAILLDQAKGGAALSSAKTSKITLEVWLEGNAAPNPVATVTVQAIVVR